MCGRFASFQPPEAIRALFRTVNPVPEDARPSWNVAPSQPALAVRRHPETGDRHLDLLIWGLVPHWTKDLKAARRPINARAESVASSSMFRGAFASRRCLVPVDAWYEWQTTAAGKRPYAFARPDRQTMAFAGLWESWKAEGTGKVLRTFAVLTTAPNTPAARVHDRMPVILRPADWPVWLGEAAGDPGALLRPAPDELVEAWAVSRDVNTPRNNNPELLAPLADLG
ncbi:SOS response-associated peptidase [Acidocella sp.]|jgi:putative SOS response-associated peptidase YedK|uniref:SOS response-associated peptidase n=1 Tax=Acidocella sp. TaxID=50710 RepID=UPI0026348933|nr:SOS response-associated peptidase [Acidocella sp.]MDD2794656.1 SOS response-associated peptidase [Acidocella sp.]